MLRFRALSITFVLIGLTGGSFVWPARAHACVWVPSHKGNPLPPCKVDDIPLRNRILQLNAHLIGKITTAAQTIHFIRKEIEAWKNTQEIAKDYKNLLQKYYRTVTSNPLPAIVAAYNAKSPIGAYLQLEITDGYQISIRPVDLLAAADSIVNRFVDIAEAKKMYFERLPNAVQRRGDRGLDWIHEQTLKRIGVMTDRRRYFEMLSDSLRSVGNELATRYIDTSIPEGESEAKIQRLSAMLNKLHGTSVEAEARALQSKAEMLEHLLSVKERNDKQALYMYSTRL